MGFLAAVLHSCLASCRDTNSITSNNVSRNNYASNIRVNRANLHNSLNGNENLL